MSRKEDGVRKTLIVKTGTLLDQRDAVVAVHGDHDAWFLRAGGLPADAVEVVAVHDGARIGGGPSDYGAILITGSSAMITQAQPWMIETAAWLRRATAAGVPTLGVCFGHQMLAIALGGTVGDHPNGIEAGAITVDINDHGVEDALFTALPRRASFQSHHYQSVTALPVGAVALASNRHDPHQAVRYAPWTWGVQFHPEIDTAIMTAILAAGADPPARLVADPPVCAITRDEPSAAGPKLLQSFIALAYRRDAQRRRA